MEGPTPVTALIHAATMVTAGVYMVARCNALFSRAPETMAIVAVVGAVTAIFAATIGIAQTDIKRVLAYSTVSQLGYMLAALGVGAFVGGIFHLMTHAFFKALLFLGSGSVIMAMHHEQDMRKMGGLRKHLALDLPDHVHRNPCDRRGPGTGRIFQQGRDPVAGLEQRPSRCVAPALAWRRNDRVLYVPAHVPDVLGRGAHG